MKGPYLLAEQVERVTALMARGWTFDVAVERANIVVVKGP